MGVSINPLEWVKWWARRNKRLAIRNVDLEYAGAEGHPEYGMLVSLELNFNLVNTTAERAKDVSYSLELKTPSMDSETRVYRHSRRGSLLDRLESQRSYAPLLVRTDFDDVLVLTDDHPDWETPTHIRTVAPLSQETSLSIKATSSSHRGAEFDATIQELIQEWQATVSGTTIGELECDIKVTWDRTPIDEEADKLVIGEDISFG